MPIRDSQMQADINYRNLVKEILGSGVRKPSRAGDTISIFDWTMKFDLRKGFPLLTTKKIDFDNIYAELMWFLRGDSNIKTLRAPQLWRPWADEKGDCGPIYGHIWRKQTKYFMVPPMVVEKDDQLIESGLSKEVIPDFSSNESGFVEKTFSSNSCGDFVVIKEYRVPRDVQTQSKLVFDVQFLASGYISKGVSKQELQSGLISDPFYPSACGVGCMGDIDATSPELKLLKETWNGLLKRCYSDNHSAYENYGGAGIFVCKRWLIFANFAEDAKKLENWLCKKEYPDEFSLDKDFYASNCYSPGTCVWSNKTEQSINTENIRLFKAISPEGDESAHVGVKHFARERGLTAQSITQVLSGKLKRHKEWQFEPLVAPEGAVPRIRVYDQLKTMIATLKHNPNDRRMLVSAWSVPDLPSMSLSPCHAFFQCYSSDGHLDLSLWQRSCDVALGVPYNIASYALLLKILAKEAGLVPRFFNHHLGDAHIYAQHEEKIRLQAQRSPREMPLLDLNGDFGIWARAKSDSPADYNLLGYDPAPFIKYEVNV